MLKQHDISIAETLAVMQEQNEHVCPNIAFMHMLTVMETAHNAAKQIQMAISPANCY